MNIQNAAPQIAQTTVLVILIASALIVGALLIFLGILVWRTERPLDTTERPLAEYAHFFLVILSILTALFGFLVGFPLLVSGVQMGVLIIVLFITIIGLVGTFYGILHPGTGLKGTSITGTLRRSKDFFLEHYTLVASHCTSTALGSGYSILSSSTDSLESTSSTIPKSVIFYSPPSRTRSFLFS
jgi:hypothetical protein